MLERVNENLNLHRPYLFNICKADRAIVFRFGVYLVIWLYLFLVSTIRVVILNKLVSPINFAAPLSQIGDTLW